MAVRTDSVQGLPQPGLDAGREMRAYHCFVNEQWWLNWPGGTVMANDGAYIDMEEGYRYIVESFYLGLTTILDRVRFEIVVTSLPRTLGEVTPLTVQYVGTTAMDGEGMACCPFLLDPKIVVSTADGQTLAMRVETTGKIATVNCGFSGWREEDR